MAKSTYVKGYLSKFQSPVAESDGAEIASWQRVEVDYQYPLDDLTGTKNGTADTERVYLENYQTIDVTSHGFLHEPDTSAYPVASAATLAIASVNLHPYDWILRKKWNLVDVTGSGDTEKTWLEDMPSVDLVARCWVLGSGPDWASQDLGITLSNSLLGTVSGTCKVQSRPLNMSAVRGWIAMTLFMRFTGAVSYSAGALDMNSVFLAGSQSPPRGTFTLTVTSGDNLTGTCMAHDVTVRATKRSGGAMPITIKHRVDET